MGSASLPPVQLQDFIIGDRIGSGSYGTVYKATRSSGPKEVVAIKAVLKKGLSKKEVDNIISEISLLKSLKHAHIVEMKDFSWDGSYVYIVMEYCGGGDLSRFIRLRKSIPEGVVKKFLQQLASALQFLQSQNISHMDLKPQNILLTHNRTLKLADFGFAKKLCLFEKEKGMRGSPLYMAPEMILNGQYDAKADIWSVGVILYECLFGQAPYKSSSSEELFDKIKEDAPIRIPSSGISGHCRDLLGRSLERDPETRIDFVGFLGHSFLDMEHMPGPKSYAKALRLSSKAQKADNDEEFEAAFKLYKESLEYFVPLIHAEVDPTKKESLRQKVGTYIIRAEALKEMLRPPPQPVQNPKTVESNTSRSPLALLKDMSLCTPDLKNSLEILSQSELYEMEGKLPHALEGYQSGLKTILPILKNEPKGLRRSLLSKEIERWISRAEHIKRTLENQEEAIMQSIESSSKDKNCSLQ
eukprot:TRINITY_DN8179_c0_g1_i1.p1 TRINITY_DN8179_c0_g1~~TRINITY_DN8179_c0_g1_i1.p1  ORF type:complete len:471 (-),score=182.70 TRINITY_DN8179_c0_g1_i1:84-1496(-)